MADLHLELTPRALQALTLVADGGLVLDESGAALVPSSRAEGAFYRTSPASCSCPDHQYRRVVCKHMLAVRLARTIAAAATETDQALAA